MRQLSSTLRSIALIDLWRSCWALMNQRFGTSAGVPALGSLRLLSRGITARRWRVWAPRYLCSTAAMTTGDRVATSMQVGQQQNAALNPLARQLFGQPVDLVYQGDDTGRVFVGRSLSTGPNLMTSTERSPASFRDQQTPLAGKAGIDAAVAKGVLRRATVVDANAWANAKAESTPNRDIPPIAGVGVPRPAAPGIHNAYVVLKSFTYPSGLYGPHAASFFIPAGVPVPDGNPGHSAVYDFNSLRCRGALCR